MDVDLIFKIAAIGILVAVLNQLLVSGPWPCAFPPRRCW